MATDQSFLQRLYVHTRAPSRLRGCDGAAEALLLRTRFLAQQTHLQQLYPDAEITIIVENDCPIGRLYVHYSDTEMRVLDLSLLPEYRGRGIGKGLLRGLQAYGERLSLPVKMQVALGNPCQRLCQRCDFLFTGIDGGYASLEWWPS
jgi:GNAT superfamily N-acetyltransferase